MHIGIIGLGDMGKLYALAFAKNGYKVCGTDVFHQLEELKNELSCQYIEVLPDGHEVSRKSDFIIYCVEAEKIDAVVSQFAKSTKYGAIVAGQTSVKHPEIAAFEKYLPADANIVTSHSLHGPGFSTEGQTLVVIRHRATDEIYQKALEVYKALGSNIIEMDSYQQHDQIVADTQAVTHMGFESMGSAWKNAGFYPWDNPVYAGGIDNVKVLTTLRIFSYKSHIYAGLAILNPYAQKQVREYAKTESELFALMIAENEKAFRAKIDGAKDFVFSNDDKPLLLNSEVMDAFSMADKAHNRKPNSHLSILSMVCAWHAMGVNPYDNLICQTPPFRLRLGIAEYLFKNEELLEETIQAALFDKSIRKDDLEFHTAVHEWASIIGYGDMKGYKAHFEAAKSFFDGRLEKARTLSTEMISKLID
ncbi:prephenate dehydrogenase [Pedobacter xixiisoli]|uniref:Prephenate dehydrogenase (NADP+) n=1 Tax=Pedobacter xixiisoli TaxID=1476464 RepID=A0A286A934_9SPHI|nr:prephenate dehydrogenase [Pedobacter xixiisoli]SOD18413.1 prephenate dehydrogenase (NADP+) [Pedobacter xixiisoli]